MERFKTTRYKIRLGNQFGSPSRPFSIVLLSDLHNISFGQNNSILLSEIRKEQPAAVMIAGDMVTSAAVPEYDNALPLLKELTKSYPVFYANGNHELRFRRNIEKYGDTYPNYVEKIRSFGVHFLENEKEETEINQIPFSIWGYDLTPSCYKRFNSTSFTQDEIESALGKPDKNRYNILLAHHPAYFQGYARWGADLTLSGHLHGGIIRIPLLGGVISPQMIAFPRYDKGMYLLEEKKMIVSAGLGAHSIKLRINNPYELVVIDFI